jgi:hypothetical protein
MAKVIKIWKPTYDAENKVIIKSEIVEETIFSPAEAFNELFEIMLLEGNPKICKNDLYYLQSIYDQYKALVDFTINNDKTNGTQTNILGQEVSYNNLDWLDCFIEKFSR